MGGDAAKHVQAYIEHEQMKKDGGKLRARHQDFISLASKEDVQELRDPSAIIGNLQHNKMITGGSAMQR